MYIYLFSYSILSKIHVFEQNSNRKYCWKNTMKPYNFVQETTMCAAGISAYESPATNQGTLMDVLKKEKKHKHKKLHKRISIPNPLKK